MAASEPVGPRLDLAEVPADEGAVSAPIPSRRSRVFEERRITVNFRALLPERFEVDVAKRYALDKLVLGEGAYGKVYVAKDTSSSRTVAVKRLTKTDSRREANFRKEIDIMKELDHPNICKILETLEQGRHLYIILEFCEGGELFDRIVDSGKISERDTAAVIEQVNAALIYAHGRGIAHRDIKPENVVFCSKDHNDFHVKVIDWGLSISFSGGSMHTAVGTLTYAAPEVSSSSASSTYTEKCDMWSLGVLTYVMLCGKPPFWGTEQMCIRNAQQEKYPMSGKVWDAVSKNAKAFIRELLKADPDVRLTGARAGEHPWLATRDHPAPDEAATSEILQHLRQFSNCSHLQAMCVALVARQLDHKHLGGVYEVFRNLDRNGDGVLSFEEVEAGFREIFGAGSQEHQEVERIFRSLDLDGSGSLDYTEFCAAGLGERATSQDDAVWAAFKVFDIDNDGAISRDEIHKVLSASDMRQEWTEEVCDQVSREILETFDRDANASIDFDEFVQMMRQVWFTRSEEGYQEDPDAGPPPLERQNSRVQQQALTRTLSGDRGKTSWAYDILRRIFGLAGG